MVNKTKWQPAEWKKTFNNHTSDKELIFKIYEELKKLDIKIQTLQSKMGCRYKQRILNRKISNGQKTLREMFNIHSCQENANQNDSEIPSYTIQNVKIKHR